MKRLGMIAAALASTVAFASPVFAGWTEVAEAGGNTWYIDIDTVKVNNGYVYYWGITDYLKPINYGVLSSKSLREVDCDTPRKSRSLSDTFYTQPMASGSVDTSGNDASEWEYPSPNSVGEFLTNKACEYAGK